MPAYFPLQARELGKSTVKYSIRAKNSAEQDSGKNGQLHPLLKKAQEDALRSQLSDLRMQLEEYEALRSGKRAVLALNSFEELLFSSPSP